MKTVRITIEATIPNSEETEVKLDEELSNLVNELGGEVLDIKEYEEIKE